VADLASTSEVWFAGVHLVLVEGDITAQHVDGIVNAANSELAGGGGVDGAVHRVGGAIILAEGKKIVRSRGRLSAGDAVSTSAGRLPAKRVIHAVGPVWLGGDRGEQTALGRAYSSCLQIAREEGLRTIAFPSISTGAYSYPLEQAARVALGAVRRSLESGAGPLAEVRFVLFDAHALQVYQAAMFETFGQQ